MDTLTAAEHFASTGLIVANQELLQNTILSNGLNAGEDAQLQALKAVQTVTTGALQLNGGAFSDPLLQQSTGDVLVANASSVSVRLASGGGVDALTANNQNLDNSSGQYSTIFDLTGSNTITSGSGTNIGLTGASGDVLNVFGSANQVYDAGNNTTVNLGVNASATIGGAGATVIGASGATAYVGGNGATASDAHVFYVDLEQGGNVVELDNSRVNVTGAGIAVGVGNNDALGLTGSTDYVTVAGTGSAVWIGGNGASASDAANNHVNVLNGGSVVELDNSRLDVTGAGIGIAAGNNDALGVTGSTDYVTVAGTGSTVTIGGNGQYASDTADNHVAFTQGGVLNQADNSRVDVGDNGFGLLVNTGSNDSTGLSGNYYTLNSSGSNNSTWTNGYGSVFIVSNENVHLTGNYTNLTVVGSGDTISSDGTTSDTVGIAGSNDIANVSYGTVNLDTSYQSTTVNGTSDTINTAWSNDTLTLAAANSNVTVNGSNLTVIGNGASDTIGFNGNNDVANLSNGVLNVDASATSLTVSGTGNTVNTGTTINDTIGFNGASNTVYLNNGAVNFDASGETATVGGTGNTISGGNWTGDTAVLTTPQTSDSLFLQYGTIDLTAGRENITVYGDHDNVDATAERADTVGFYGGGDQNVHINDGTVNADTSSTGVTVHGNDDKVTGAQGATIGIDGTEDTAYLNSGTINIDDQGVKIGIDGSYDHIGGSGDSIYVDGTHDGTFGNNDTLYENSPFTDYSSGSNDYYGGGYSDGGYGYYGYGFARSTPGQHSAIHVIAQFDQSNGYAGAEAGAQVAYADASASAAGTLATTASDADTLVVGPVWHDKSISWSFAAPTDSGNMPISGAIDPQYQATIEKAFQAWANAGGLTFEQVDGSGVPADLQIGWGAFDTANSGVIGYTGVKGTSGDAQPGAVVRLEDPNETQLTSDANGGFTYADEDATLYQVALHEIGHALGLGDSSDPNSVMYFMLGNSNLQLDDTDIAAITAAYGTQTSMATLATTVAALQTANPTSQSAQDLIPAGISSPDVPGSSVPPENAAPHPLVAEAGIASLLTPLSQQTPLSQLLAPAQP
jgi:hypothetical protein